TCFPFLFVVLRGIGKPLKGLPGRIETAALPLLDRIGYRRSRGSSYDKKSHDSCASAFIYRSAAARNFFRLAASLGFEPRQRDPESLVLPLHHEAMNEKIKARIAHCKSSAVAFAMRN